MNKFFTKGAVLGLLIATFAVSSSLTFAADTGTSSTSTQSNFQERFAHHEEREQEREKIRTAVESGDYAAFQAAAVNSPLEGKIDSQAKFDKLVEAKKLRESGDHEGAKAIMDELGIKPPRGHMGGEGMHEGRDGKGGEMKAAIESGDYEAFKALVDDSHFAGIIDTQAKFDKLVEACKLKDSGDNEGAKAIMDELGVKPPQGNMGHGRGGRGGMMHHFDDDDQEYQRGPQKNQ